MATLVERIEADYKTAMKSKDRLRVDTLRLMKAAIQQVTIERKQDTLDDKSVIQVVSNQAKQRRETIESAKKGGRDDVLQQSMQELAILHTYLPEQLSEEALTKLIDEAIQVVGSNRGQIMKSVMEKAAGAADGKLVNQLVGARLAKGSGS